MKKRLLGKTSIELSEVGLGTWEMSGDVYGKKDDRESVKTILTAIDHGVRYIDTAAGYGKGHVEELLGSALKQVPKNSDVKISTKIFPQCGIFAPPPEKHIEDFFSPLWIENQCDASLKRLQRDCIDILFLHTWNRAWAHETAWFEAMQALKQKGKIRAIGISIPDEGIADANVHIEAGRVDVIQCVYNLFQQEPEYSLFPLAKKNQIGIIARSPFSSGVLNGTWSQDMIFPPGDWRGIWPLEVKPGWLQEQVGMANAVKEILDEGMTLHDAALLYVLQHANVTSVIPGTANPEHAVQNIEVTQQPSLSWKFLDRMKELWIYREIHGTYNGSA